MYDFEVEPYNNTPEDRKMIYIANSSEPSKDDEFAEFYSISVWNKRSPIKQKYYPLNVAEKKDNIFSCSGCEDRLNFKVIYTEKFDRMKMSV